MTRRTTFTHEFVETIPGDLGDGILYVCVPYATVVHACFCGCRAEIVTPLSPTDWRLSFDGESISLSPSVGNWSYECQSHYILDGGRVRWASRWSKEEVQRGRDRDRAATRHHHEQQIEPTSDRSLPLAPASEPRPTTWWRQLRDKFVQR